MHEVPGRELACSILGLDLLSRDALVMPTHASLLEIRIP